MSTDVKKAEQTAINAAQAMVRIIDYGVATLTELAKAVASLTGFRLTRTDPVRYSTRDAYVVQRYTRGEGQGEVHAERYLYSPFIAPYPMIKEAGGGRMIPFLLVSLVNSEARPPEVIYGLLRDLEGRERNEEAFLEHYLLWLNEGLDVIAKEAKRDKKAKAYRITKELPARAEVHILSATLLFDRTALFQINESNVAQKAEELSQWFLNLFGADSQ